MTAAGLRRASGLCGMGRNILAAIAFSAAAAQPATAQDVSFGRDVWLKQANCADCHGWLATGIPEDPRAPKGANLRETTLTAAQISEVILCGRPGTGMPHFDQRAYTDARCYGQTKAQLGDAAPPQGVVALTKRHADSLAAFILAEFAGKGPPSREECITVLGTATPRCGNLPPRGK